MRWRVDEKNLSLALQLACQTELCVLIDPVRTRQIMLNLLVNAIKSTSAGSPPREREWTGSIDLSRTG